MTKDRLHQIKTQALAHVGKTRSADIILECLDEIQRLQKMRACASDDKKWLNELSLDPAFKGVNVVLESAKALRWCKENKRELTRRFLVNWLNKSDRTISVNRGAVPARAKPRGPDAPEWTDEQLVQNKEFFAGLTKKLVGGPDERDPADRIQRPS